MAKVPKKRRPSLSLSSADKIFWTDQEKAEIVVRGREILSRDTSKNLTGVLLKSQEVLPENRQRNIATAYGPGFAWFIEPMRAYVAHQESPALDAPPAAEGFSPRGGPANLARTGFPKDWKGEPGESPVTMEQLLACDPRLLLRALEQYCIDRFETLSRLIVDVDAVFAKMSALRSLDPAKTQEK